MKKFFLSVLLMTATWAVSAQDIRLNGYAMYVFDDGFNVYNDANSYYYGKLKGGLQVGGGVEFMPNPMYGVEVLYLYKKTDAPATFKFGTLTTEKNETFDVEHHWIMLSGNSHRASADGRKEFGGGLMLGALISNVDQPSTGNSASNTTFAWGFKLGGDFWLSEKVAIKLQTHLLSSARATGGEVYYGYWGPVAVPGYSTLWQFALGGGLAFKLGK